MTQNSRRNGMRSDGFLFAKSSWLFYKNIGSKSCLNGEYVVYL